MRDRNLDIIKGLACILMIFAHSRTLGRTIETPLTDPFWQIGYFAPVLFLASIGPSLDYQLKKRPALAIIVFNLILLLFSFADRAREKADYLNLTDINLIGSLAIGTIFVLLFRKINSLIMFIFLFGLDRFLNKFALGTSIFFGLPFSLIPWAGFIFLGIFLYKKNNWTLYILAAGALISFHAFILKKQTIDTQLPTTAFLGLSLIIYPLCLMSAKWIGKIGGISALLIYLGKNTLLFYWLHLIILFTITPFVFPAPAMWIYTLSLTLIGMLAFQKINRSTFYFIADRLWFWLVLTSFVFMPLFVNLKFEQRFYVLSPVIVIFALNYRQFFQLKIIKALNK